ncbi:hypothetical protein Ssi03_11940 [Sphaerisporangium siamense]|nr:hypothetical protein Ssi03_11940 [Sphaerisporangium siamense]
MLEHDPPPASRADEDARLRTPARGTDGGREEGGGFVLRRWRPGGAEEVSRG